VKNWILEKIKGFFFFGVPHLGMEMSHLLTIVKDQPNEPLVRALSHEDGYLLLLDEQFRGISVFSKVRTISAYETKLSRSAQVGTTLSLCYRSWLSSSTRRCPVRAPCAGQVTLMWQWIAFQRYTEV
jgi:hypothetical protein